VRVTLSFLADSEEEIRRTSTLKLNRLKRSFHPSSILSFFPEKHLIIFSYAATAFLPISVYSISSSSILDRGYDGTFFRFLDPDRLLYGTSENVASTSSTIGKY